MQKNLKLILMFFIMGILFMVFAGCGQGISEGSYTGAADGYHGELSVTTKIDGDGKILSILVGENTETPDIGTVAIEKIPERIITAQSLGVDDVAGATVTSRAIVDAVADSLRTAGLDPLKYAYLAPTEEKEEAWAPFNQDALPVKQKTTETIQVTDVKGRKVDIDLPISTYAVSTMDVIDYIIPLKGADAFAMLVGSGQDGGHGLQKYAKLYTPEVGNYTEHVGQISDHNAPFDLEMILAVSPDVLIVNSAMAAHKYALEIEDQLKAAGIPLVLIDVPGKKMEKSVQETMHLLGQIFQEEGKGREVAAFIDQQYGLIAARGLGERKAQPTVYYEKSGYSEIYGSTSASTSGWGTAVAIAGGNNIADDLLMNKASGGGNNNTLDPEYVIKADPDYIILSGINDGWLDCLQEKKSCVFDIVKRTGWSDLRAVREGKLYEFAHSTSRSIFAFYPCLKMAKIFYPAEFADVDPEARLDEFFQKFMLLDSDITTWFMSLEDGSVTGN